MAVGLHLMLIVVVTIGAVPAPSPRLAPGPDDARCFPQTDHCIRGRFRTYWEHGGGLLIFGYPITAARMEQQSDGTTLLVQWFERVRFELHPEHVAPYDVLLTRLGAHLLPAFGHPAIAQPEPGPQPGCVWFPATRFNVCDTGEVRFKTFWQTRGQPTSRTASDQQSLAVFGQPITRLYATGREGKTLVFVQWFERARFELRLNPSNPQESIVMLGLLGQESRASSTTLYMGTGHTRQAEQQTVLSRS